jgi:hypothetical protein
MMLAGAPFTDKLLAHANGERHVKQPVAVNVSEFSTADAEFPASKTVRHGFDSRPTEHSRFNLLRSSGQWLSPRFSRLLKNAA